MADRDKTIPDEQSRRVRGLTQAPPPPSPVSGGGSTSILSSKTEVAIERAKRARDEAITGGVLAREAIAQERAEGWERLLPKDLTEEQARDFWAKEDEWELYDAALLLEGIEPRPDRGSSLKKYMEGYDDRYAQDYDTAGADEAEFVRLARIVRRALTAHRNEKLAIKFNRRIGSDREYATVEPSEFLRWATDKGYKPPPALAPIADMKSRAELEQEVKRLTAELDRRSKSQWPWGDHTTELLGHLAATAEHWWKNYDPSDQTTAPTNKHVTEWLISERKVRPRVAEMIAQILRADDVPMGPRAAKPKKTSRPQRP